MKSSRVSIKGFYPYCPDTIEIEILSKFQEWKMEREFLRGSTSSVRSVLKTLLKLKFSLFEEKKEKKRRRNTNFNSKTRYPKKHPFRESRVPDSLEDREERKRKKKNRIPSKWNRDKRVSYQRWETREGTSRGRQT